MSTAAIRRERRENYRLEVSSYDRASSLLVSMLVMAGVTFIALLIIFFARAFVSEPVPIPLTPLEPGDRPEEAAMGVAQDIEPPGVEDAPELTEPSLMDTLNALTSTQSSKVAMLSDQALDANKTVGKGSGLGDSRKAGGGTGGPSRGRDLNFDVANLAEYAAFLDFHKIELGVFTPGRPNVSYASRFANAKPDTRQGKYGQEKRYMFNVAGQLRTLNQRLVEKAGIAGTGQFTGMFLPNEAYTLLVVAEERHAGQAGKPIDAIEHTVFNVTRKGSRFEFSVEEQLYY